MSVVDLKLNAVLDYVDEAVKKIKPEVTSVVGKDGKAGERGPQGPPGPAGMRGLDGKDGRDGKDGKDGKDGEDGVSVVDARVDFDGGLVLTLSTGDEIDAGNVAYLAPDDGPEPLTRRNISLGGDGGSLSGGRLTENLDLGTKGFTRNFTAAESVVAGDLCYYNTSGKMAKVDANTEGAANPLIAVATEALALDEEGAFFINGFYPKSGYSAGEILYVSETTGEFTNIRPSSAGVIVRVMGYAVGPDEIFFNPDTTWIQLEI